MAASAAAMELLEELLQRSGTSLHAATGFVSDLGPGSFTGVRVGVTLAKTFGYALNVKVAGLTSFDLISAEQTVVIPSKKGEFFVRRQGTEPVRSKDLPDEPSVGFGHGRGENVYPSASSFAKHVSALDWVEPEVLVPAYFIEPSISIPKKPFAGGVGG